MVGSTVGDGLSWAEAHFCHRKCQRHSEKKMYWICMCVCESVTVWFPQLALLITLQGDAGLTDWHTFISTHIHRGMLTHTLRKGQSRALTPAFIKTLISGTESLGERNLMCMGEKREDKQQTERERETDGQRDGGQRTEVQWAQVGMKNGFRRGGGWRVQRCVLSTHWKNKQVLKIEFEGKPASLVNVFRYK